MDRIAIPGMGPYAKWVSDFLTISAKAFSLLGHIQRPEISDEDSAARRAFFDLSVNAEATSLAARVAVTHSLAVPAFALTRVRLEQCIVSSFLVHAPQEKGMRRYLGHIPVQMYKVAKKYESHFQTGSDMTSLERAARKAQARFKERYEEKWTSLKLPQMAKQRDTLAKEISPLPWRLEDEYRRLNSLTSLAVHGESSDYLLGGRVS